MIPQKINQATKNSNRYHDPNAHNAPLATKGYPNPAHQKNAKLPPTTKILTIVLVNSASSLVSDFCWAYAMLLTSPLVVTVGLSLTIPLSLVGQMVLDEQYASWLYWVGAVMMVVSFVFINREERLDEEEGRQGEEPVIDVRRSMNSLRESLSSRRSSGLSGGRV